MSYFNWWSCCILAMGISHVIFLVGRPFYRYRTPEGSPLIPMLQVLLAAFVKRNLPYPSDVGELHEVSRSQQSEKRLLCHSNQFRFLDKAAIIEQMGNETTFTPERLNRWRLPNVTQVEEMKLILSIIPIWVASLPFGICVAQASTFFIKQGSIMDRKITSSFKIPPASLYSFAAVSMITVVSFYDKILVSFCRRVTGNRSVNPQFMILGIGDGFTVVGLQMQILTFCSSVQILTFC